MPVVLFIWHKLIQPLIDRWYGKPKLESGKQDGLQKSNEKVSELISIYDIYMKSNLAVKSMKVNAIPESSILNWFVSAVLVRINLTPKTLRFIMSPRLI